MHNGVVHTLVTIFFRSYFRGIESFVTLGKGNSKTLQNLEALERRK